MNTQTQHNRRTFLALAGSATLLGARVAAQDRKTLGVGIIGATGRGNYGHELDRVWLKQDGVRIVAVADAHKKGLASAVKRLRGPQGYSDYKKMLAKHRPELVSVCPSWPDQHADMIIAAAQNGARGILVEKPYCRSLVEVDRITAVCRKHGVKLAIAHKNAYHPALRVIRKFIESGGMGKPVSIEGRGKEDGRGGSEDLWVLGSHVLDVMIRLAGTPTWCSAKLKLGDRLVEPRDIRKGGSGLGLLAGDRLEANYGFPNGVKGRFVSVKNAGRSNTRFAVKMVGTKGTLDFLLERSPVAWYTAKGSDKRQPIGPKGVGQAEGSPKFSHQGWTLWVIEDLIKKLDTDREPVCGLASGKLIVEMISGVFESHRRKGERVEIPLSQRKHPLQIMRATKQ